METQSMQWNTKIQLIWQVEYQYQISVESNMFWEMKNGGQTNLNFPLIPKANDTQDL